MVWTNVASHIPKSSRYGLGSRIENKFLDLLELSFLTYFSEKEQKLKKLEQCISTLDTLKFLVLVAWEAKFISHGHYESLILSLGNLGRMFGGWKKKTPANGGGDRLLSKTKDDLIV